MENSENCEPIQPRKSLYMRIAPIVDTYDDIIKNKLESGKFPFTTPGILKLIAMICLIASLGFFFGTSLCDKTSAWYPYLLPSSVALASAILLILYIIFASGQTTKNPAFWVKFDIILNLALAVVGITAIITSMCDCGKGEFFQISIGAVGILGYLMSVIGCISIFLMYRFVDEVPSQVLPRPRMDPRKSVFA